MADTELQDLIAVADPAISDILYCVIDPGSVPASRKLTIENLFKKYHFEVSGTEVVFNEAGADIDFRVEAVGVDPAFLITGDAGLIQIGAAAGAGNVNITPQSAISALSIYQANEQTGITIDNDSGGSLGIDIYAKYPIRLTQDLIAGYGLEIIRNNDNVEAYPLVILKNDHASDTQATLSLQNDGSGPHITTGDTDESLFIDPNGAGVTRLGANSGSGLLNITPQSAIRGLSIDQDYNANAIYIDSEGTSAAIDIAAYYGMRILQDVSNGLGLLITRDINEVGAQSLVKFRNDHISDAQATLSLQNDGSGPHITTGATNEDLKIDPNGTGDINLLGNYTTRQQNIPDLASKGPAYWFDGDNDYISLGTDTDLDLGTGDGSYFFQLKNTGNDGADNRLFEVYDVGSTDQQLFKIDSSGYLYGQIRESGTVKYVSANKTDIGADGLQHTIAFTIDRDSATGLKLYLGGQEESYTTQEDPTGISGGIVSTGPKYIGVEWSGSGSEFAGEISRSLFFNLALTAAEVKALSSGAPVPFKYVGASQTEMITDPDNQDFGDETINEWTVYTDGNGTCAYDDGPASEYTAKVTVGATPGTYTGGRLQSSEIFTFEAGKTYKIKAGVYIPSANNNWTLIRASFAEFVGSTYRSFSDASLVTEDSWQTIEVERFFASDVVGQIVVYGNSTTTGDIFYFDNISVTQIGCVLQLEQDGIGASKWLDKSGNNLDGTVSGALPVNLPVTENVMMENLLTNSEFSVWSNSVDLYDPATGLVPVVGDGNDLVTNGEFDAGIGDWRDNCTGDGDFAWDTDHAELDANTGTAEMAQTLTVETGKLYELTFAIAENCTSLLVTGGSSADGGTEHFTYTYTATGTETIVFEAAGTSVYLEFASGTDEVVSLDDIGCHEVTPGCVAVNTLACDGWLKTSGHSIYREHSGSNTKSGSFYALKSVPSAQYDSSTWPSGISGNVEHRQRFEGRTVTFGAWVKSSTASDLILVINDGGTSGSSYHTGGGAWEWLEVTKTISTSISYLNVYWDHQNASPGTAYISQPMLVFGNAIGEGNYSRPPGEFIWFENAGGSGETLNDFGSYDNFSDSDMQTINLEAQSNGWIPKGVKAVFFMMRAKENTSAGKALWLRGGTTGPIGIDMISQVATVLTTAAGWQPCDTSGDVEIDATVGTDWDDVDLYPQGVQLR